MGLSLKNEEVLPRNERVGRYLIQASDILESEEVREFGCRTAKQIKEVLAEYVYNVE